MGHPSSCWASKLSEYLLRLEEAYPKGLWVPENYKASVQKESLTKSHIHYHYGIRSQKTILTMVLGT